MKRELMNCATRVAVMMLIWAILVTVASGCAMVHEHDTVVRGNRAMAKEWKPSKRCKTLGKAKTSHVAIVVQKDCFRNGVTTVGIVVLNTEKKGAVADQHTKQALFSILGYHPALALVVASRHKYLPFALAVVTGARSSAAVAKR